MTFESTDSRARTFEPAPLRRSESLSKRTMDLVLSCIGLVLSGPLWPVIAASIKLEDGGPVFYTQERWGRGRKKFTVLKFRTMDLDDDGRSTVQPATENDHRITRIGRILRATGLDELPQLVNVWRGEMSFVGPRALAVGEFVDNGNGGHIKYENLPEFKKRLAVRPGLTSIATVYLARDVSRRRKFRYDLLYIKTQTIWLDLRLIAISLWISFRGKWETRGTKL